MKWVIVLIPILLMALASCSQSIEPSFKPVPPQTPNPTPTSTPTPSPETNTYTEDWATNQVSNYLNNLATRPEAIRYLADLNSEGWFEGEFYESEVDQDLGGHSYSGWQVYYRPTGSPSREYWGNLNWATFKDGYVTEGSNDALRVKADLLELNEPKSPLTQKPGYETVTFTLEPDSDHMFPIYVKSDQTLHLTWFVKEGEKVWFHILTPSNINLGFYENGQYANGTLTPDTCQGFPEGRTVFSPSEYAWGEGYYEMFVTSYSTIPLEVEVNYWIEDTSSP
jgi:hypothetical protein